MQLTRSQMESLMARTVELAEQALTPGNDDMVVAGQTRLMGVQDLSDLERLRELFDVFASKREILQLLERTSQAPGVRIFIGAETRLFSLSGSAVIAAPYMSGRQRVLGAIGVIGPARLNYARVIPLVDYTARVLGRMLDGNDT